MRFWVTYGDALTESPQRIRGPSSRPQACLLILAASLSLQPGVDVRPPVAGRAPNSDECRPGSYLPPSLEGADAHLQLVGELLLGWEFLGHLPPGRLAGRILSGAWSVTTSTGAIPIVPNCADGALEEPAGRCRVPPRGHEHVDDLPELVDRAVDIAPPAGDLDRRP
jgi:hypothetical protein